MDPDTAFIYGSGVSDWQWLHGPGSSYMALATFFVKVSQINLNFILQTL